MNFTFEYRPNFLLREVVNKFENDDISFVRYKGAPKETESPYNHSWIVVTPYKSRDQVKELQNKMKEFVQHSDLKLVFFAVSENSFWMKQRNRQLKLNKTQQQK